MLNRWRTLTGAPAAQIPRRLSRALQARPSDPADPEGPWAAQAVRLLTDLFGPYGLGWALHWEAADLAILGDPARPTLAVKRAELRYTLVDDEGRERTAAAPCAGAVRGELPGALRAVRAVLLWDALSRLAVPWEEPSPKRRPAGRTPARRERGSPAAPAEAPPPPEDPGRMVIPVGQYRGEKLSEVSPAVVRWCAYSMRPRTAEEVAFQAAARAYLERLEAGR